MPSSPVPDRRLAPLDTAEEWPLLAGPAPREPSARSASLATKLLVPLAVVLVLVVGVFYVAFDFGSVDGPSMLPNLLEVDGLLITKRYTEPRRGDLVVLRIVGQNGLPEAIVKRVVAVPGDTLEVRDDVAYVNGVPESGYDVLRGPAGSGDTLAPVTVRPGFVYVMGDNRPVSYDSRYIGPQPLSSVDGRVAAIYMPITRWRLVPRLPAETP